MIQIQPATPAGATPAQAALTTTLSNGHVVALHRGRNLAWSLQAIAALTRLRVEVPC